MKKVIRVTFKNVLDFRNRIAGLWQDQKEDEEYEYVFLDEETRKEFEDLAKAFEQGAE